MYSPVPTQPGCAAAWVAAASAVIQSGDESYNVVIDIENPWKHNERDHAVIALVDDFLRAHGENPIVTVANTIFPQALLEGLGSPAFYATYHENFDRLSSTKRWGRYFERMTRHEMGDGTQYNPLVQLIDRMSQQEETSIYTSAYELAIYDPLKDGRAFYGGQCLSFLSFKRHPTRGLMLTAMYRNHTYITRCLGNLIGLGRLQQFVASQVGIETGPLTVISTHAVLEAKSNKWGIKDARSLVARAALVLSETPSRAVAASR